MGKIIKIIGIVIGLFILTSIIAGIASNCGCSCGCGCDEDKKEEKKNWVTVYVYLNGGTVNGEDGGDQGCVELTHTVAEGYSLRLPTPYKTGYNFCGYFDQAGSTMLTDKGGYGVGAYSGSYEAGKYPTNFYAQWEARDFNVTIDPQDSTLLGNNFDLSIPYGFEMSKLTATGSLPVCEKSGKTFLGYTVSAFGSDSSKLVTNEYGVFLPEYSTLTAEKYSFLSDSSSNSFMFVPVFENISVSVNLFDQDGSLYKTLKVEAGATLSFIEEYPIYAKKCMVGFNLDSQGFDNLISFPYKTSSTGGQLNLYCMYRNSTQVGLHTDNGVANYSGSATDLVIPDLDENGVRVTRITTITDSALETIYMPHTLTSLSSNIFENCTKLRSVNLPIKLKEIPEAAFRGCSSLTKIDIPYYVEKVGKDAFKGCDFLKTISLPDRVSAYGEEAFNCKGIESFNVIETDAKTHATCLDNGALIGNSSYNGSRAIIAYPKVNTPKSFVINDYYAIDKYAFAYNNCLTKVTFSSTSTARVLDYAFYQCTNLSSVILREDKKMSADFKVTLHDQVFSGCANLKAILLFSKNKVSLNSSSIGINDTATIFVPSDLLTVYQKDSNWKPHLSNIRSLGDNVAGDYAFNVISIENNTVSLVAYLGDGNASFSMPSILNGYIVAEISEYVFMNNDMLKSVTFEFDSEMALIKDGAFIGCSNLTTIYLNGNSMIDIEGVPFEDSVRFILPQGKSELLSQYQSSANWARYKNNFSM